METKITGKLILQMLGIGLDTKTKQSLMRNNIAAGAAIGIATLFPGIIGMIRSLISPHSYVIPQESFLVSLMVLISSLLMVMHGWLLLKHRIRDPRNALPVMLVYIFCLMSLGVTSSLRRVDSITPILPFILTAIVILNMFALTPVISIPLTMFAVWFIYLEMGNHDLIQLKPFNVILVWLAVCSVSVYRYISVYFSIKQRETITRQNEELRRLSEADALTGLGNRYGLRKRFDSYLNQETAVIMMDIDHFKEYNDTNGHRTGDAILKEFASIIMAHFGKENSYRFGGDEMLVVVPMEAEAFRKELQEVEAEIGKIHLPGLESSPTGSIGYVTGKVKTSEELREMIRQADYHLYQAKELGRARTVGKSFDPSIRDEMPALFQEMRDHRGNM
jgi:diguanylate cyclase (GGDEF)-like protein